MKTYLIKALLISLMLVSPLSAQLPVPKITEDDERIAKNIADATALTQKNMVSGAQSQAFKRVQEIQQRQAAFLQSFSEGKVRPFANHVEKWADYEKQVLELNEHLDRYNTLTSATEKETLLTFMLEEIQPIGRFLRAANHKGFRARAVTEEQSIELNELMNAYNTAPSSDEGSSLSLITPHVFYTLKHFPMPVQFKAPEGVEIFLYSELGGQFENGMDYMKITANEQGLATTWWVSHGDGVEACNIIYRSSAFPDKGRITPYVKTLKLMSLADLSPVYEATGSIVPGLKDSMSESTIESSIENTADKLKQLPANK